MHPGQYTLINSADHRTVQNSVKELRYHADVLDALGLDATAKIQVHVGGVYGDKPASMRRFVQQYRILDPAIKRRLVIENDDRSYTVADCLSIASETGIPVLFDVFHHELNGTGTLDSDYLNRTWRTWQQGDGIPMVDYSSQKPGGVRVHHAETIDTEHFCNFLYRTRPQDFDIMLEIKDKDRSALKAVQVLEDDSRFFSERTSV